MLIINQEYFEYLVNDIYTRLKVWQFSKYTNYILPSTGGGGHATLQRTRKAVVRPTPSAVIKLSIFFKK